MSTDAYVHRLVPGREGAPLLAVFHGTGGSEDQLPALGRELMPEATILSPRGDVIENGAARFFRRTAEGVYDMEDLARASAKMANFLDGHRRAANAPALYGLGYSNGANILATTMFLRPDLVDAAVLMHPLIPFQPKVDGNLRGRRVLITAGRRDPICPPALTTRLEAWLLALGAEVDLHWHEGGHEISPSEIEAARAFLTITGDLK